ncbi:FHA domain-containing protein [Haloferula chungangensis]|uniref:FHA domain-containing protein n=1 Tax=Haloferula chungangensis TaxID=1048331 RepID=A0ABW2L2T8_9BACT
MPRVTITVPDKKSQPYRFALDRKSVTLGRGSENDITVDCGSVSVRHAVMERVKGGYQLRDLGSTNGTKLNGKARDIIELFDGAPVKIGDVEFGFTLTPEEIAEMAKEGPADSPIVKEDSGSPRRKPESRRSAQPSRPPVMVSQPSGGASFLMTLLFLILAAGSFYVGLSIRHSKETGRSLTQDIKHGVPQASESDEMLIPGVADGDSPEASE